MTVVSRCVGARSQPSQSSDIVHACALSMSIGARRLRHARRCLHLCKTSVRSLRARSEGILGHSHMWRRCHAGVRSLSAWCEFPNNGTPQHGHGGLWCTVCDTHTYTHTHTHRTLTSRQGCLTLHSNNSSRRQEHPHAPRPLRAKFLVSR